MKKEILFIFCRKNLSFSIIIGFFLLSKSLFGQYSKNPLLEITHEGYSLLIEKYVQIPDDDEVRPRINCLTSIDDRIFVSTETGGKIYEIIGDSAVELFLDVKSAITMNTGRELIATGNWHSGLRSIAFHPEFSSNGKFYTSLMEERPADTTGHHYVSDVAAPIEADGVVAEWTYDFGDNQVDVNSYREVLRIGVPYFDHPMKQIAFNPYSHNGDEDFGLLYIGHGDGHLYNNPGNGGQDNNALGKILRINPLATDSTPYEIPESNPFLQDTNWLDAIYATGFRNPHSLCFLRDTSDETIIFSSNAGRDNIEEINVVRKGENYGWSLREGTYVQLENGGTHTGIEALPDDEVKNGFTFPAAQWSQSDEIFADYGGRSIVGGYIDTIAGSSDVVFLSADFPESGIIMYNHVDELLQAITKLDSTDSSKDEPEELTQAPFYLLDIYFDDDGDTLTPPVKKENMLDVIDDDADYDGSGRADLRFGRDNKENIYITSKRNGWIYKIISINAEAPIAISSQKVEELFTIYPNPAMASGKVQVEFLHLAGRNSYLELTAMDGRIVMMMEIPEVSDKIQIDLGVRNIKPGIYKLIYHSHDNVHAKSIVIY